MPKFDTNLRGSKSALWLIVALSFLVLLPFGGNYFISDDFDLIAQVSRGGPFAIWSTAPANFFRPLVSVSLWLCHALGGWNSWAYYLPNFLLHALNAGLVFLTAKRFLEIWSPKAVSKAAIAAFAALVFMASPSHAEALFWVSCRTDLLAAAFGLLAVYLFLTAVQTGRSGFAAGAVLSLGLGCLCKESVYALLLFFAATAFLLRKDSLRARPAWIATGLSFLLIVAVVALRSRVVTSPVPYGADPGNPVEMVKAVARFGLMLIRPLVPLDPNIAMGREAPSLEITDILLLAVTIIASGAAALYLLRNDGPKEAERLPLLPPLLAFFATGLPVCFLAMPVMSPEGGRLMYLPSAFSIISLAFIAGMVLKPNALRVTAAVLAASGVAFTYLNGTLYRKAGQVCAATVEWMRAHRPTGEPAVIFLPDSLNGRYVWRNGFQGALEGFAPGWAVTPHLVVVKQTIGSSEQGGKELNMISMDEGTFNAYAIAPGTKKLLNATVIVVSNEGKIRKTTGVEIILPAKYTTNPLAR